jgi:hypothetical protein
MLKQCAALLLLLAFTAMTFSKAVIVVDFYVHQDNIAKYLCENRDKPMMHCCGRCQLRKRLAAQDAQDKNSPDRRSDTGNEVLFCEQTPAAMPPPARALDERVYAALSPKAPTDRPSTHFHPPSAQPFYL